MEGSPFQAAPGFLAGLPVTSARVFLPAGPNAPSISRPIAETDAESEAFDLYR